ncbi:MAG: M1 family metallopeptidase [Solirubrobacterales bacterium]
MARLKRLLPCLLLAGLFAAPLAHAGGSSEPFFPRAGNRGYDVSSYDVRLRYAPASGRVRATTTIAAAARQGLTRFSLDLYGLHVSRVTVDGEAASFHRGRGKLKIDVARRIPSGTSFEVVVAYDGRPRRVIDPDGTSEGWNRTDDGVLAVGEPVGTPAWIPCNDSLADKASFAFAITVPAGLKAVANGRLRGVDRDGGLATFEWGAGKPMAPYLALLDVGRGRLTSGRAAGVPAWTLVDPRYAEHQRALLSLPEAIRFVSSLFGPYPFEAAGSVVDYAPHLGYALETQTRPIYAFAPDVATLVHETAHQWFGDSVGLRRWPEIWLNEGFATWTQWFYAERHGGPTVAQTFRRLYATPASDRGFWDPPSGHPGSPRHLFGSSVYARGGMALQALREAIGTRDLLAAIRLWATGHRYSSGTIAEFEALAEEVSGEDLAPLFRRWLYEPGKPPA